MTGRKASVILGSARMFARLVRQYRRIGFIALLLGLYFVLALVAGQADAPVMAGPVAGPIGVLLALLIVAAVPTLVLALLLPGFLPLLELWLLAILLAAALDPLVAPLLTALDAPALTYCLSLLLAFVMVERCLYGPWLRNLHRRDMRARTHSFTIRATPAELWPVLVPDPRHVDRYHWPQASFLAPEQGSDADLVLILPRRTGYKDAAFDIVTEAREDPRHVTYRALPRAGCDDPAERVQIELAPIDETRTKITYTRQLLDIPIGKRLFFWLSHDFRDTCASLRARLSKRPDRSLQGAQMLRARKPAA